MCSKGSRFTLGVWGLRVCSLDVAFASATVRNRPQPFARSPYGHAYGKFCRRGHFWRFPTFRCFISRGRRGTLWHSDVFCNVSKVVLCGRRNTFAMFSKDAWQFSWQAQHFRRVVSRVFCKSHWHGCVKWRQGENSVAGVAFCDMWWKLTEASHETSILRLQILEVPRKTRRKTSILKLQRVKIGGSLARNARFGAPTRLVSSLWFSRGFAVSMGEAGKPLLFECVQAGCHVVLRGRRDTLWHSNLFDNVSKMSNLEEVSHEMLVFLHPRVSSRVAGFPVASPCLWGKLENISYSNVSKQVVMSFCVAGVALCDIPTCLIMCRKYQNWRKSRTKCCFFLHPRVSSRVSGFPVASPCLWWKLRTPHSTLYTPEFTL